MEVILLEKVQRLGSLGDKVSVKPGFARNYLIPKGIAVVATPANTAEFEARRAEFERREAEALDTAEKRVAALEKVEVTVLRKAGEGGRLFGSVGSADIAHALEEAGHEVSRQQVRMPGGEPIRQLGEHAVTIHVHAGVEAVVRLKVEPETVGGEERRLAGAEDPSDAESLPDAESPPDDGEPSNEAPEPAADT